MKKISMALLMSMVVGAANAGFIGNDNTMSAEGGFVGGPQTVFTVAQASDMRDDTDVVVVGKIVRSLGDEKYVFEDATGSITVEIDDDDWRGQTVTPSDTVKLSGEIDRGLLKTEIDVDYVELLK